MGLGGIFCLREADKRLGEADTDDSASEQWRSGEILLSGQTVHDT